MNNSPKRLLLFALALVAMILLLIADGLSTYVFLLMIAGCTMFGYLALVVLMACAGRDLGSSGGIESAGGFVLVVFSIAALVKESARDLVLAGVIIDLVLGSLLLLFQLF